MMRAFLNLSVGKKLAVSGAVALAMVVGIVVGTHWTGSAIDALFRQEGRIDQGAETLALAQRTVAEAPLHAQRIAIAQTGDEVGAALVAARGNVARTIQLTRQAEPDIGDPEATRILAEAVSRAEAFGAVLEDMARLRRAVIQARDDAFLTRAQDYDQAFEGANATIEFDVPAEAREEVRTRFVTFHQAFNDMRASALRFLATGDERMAQRVRRANAQARVHLRGAITGAEAAPRAAEELGRIAAIATEAGEGAVATIDQGRALNALLEGRAAEARNALIAAFEEAERKLAEIDEASFRAVGAALDLQERLGIGMALAIAVLLSLSAFVMARAIGSPLKRLAGTLDRIAAGDAAVAVPDRGRRDEIGRIADAVEALRGTAADAFSRSQVIEQMPLGVMLADPANAFRISYANAESRSLVCGMGDQIHVKAEDLVGQSIDILDKGPARIRALLSDPANLPHKARVAFGTEVLDLNMSAVRDAAGTYVGAMLAWSRVTDQARLADTFEADIGAVVGSVAAAAAQLQQSARTLTAAAA
ncbi:HAMP domain-containing protein, partial [Neoroseomonas rubea]|uniref:HAMP domain-containing protein n=1 Tax=Neoroseomonas rubea TaxID=2748666 RepID=UPI0018DEF3C5